MLSVNLIGNLGRDCETVTSKQGNTLYKLAVAVNNSKEEKPMWFDVLMRERPKIKDFLYKGAKVYIQGDFSIVFANGFVNLQVFCTHLELLNRIELTQEQQASIPCAVSLPTNQDPLMNLPL